MESIRNDESKEVILFVTLASGYLTGNKKLLSDTRMVKLTATGYTREKIVTVIEEKGELGQFGIP